MISLMKSNYKLPINIGNPNEFTINELANMIIEKVNPSLKKVYEPLPQDDPLQRNPVIEIAKNNLGWMPNIALDKGIDETINYFKRILSIQN